MSDDSSYLYTTESVIFFLVILFLLFCSGLLKAIKHYFRKPDFRPPIRIPPAPPVARDLLAAHISLPQSRQAPIMTSNINIIDDQISPPPYSAAIIPPPSYDEATKQFENTTTAAKY